MADELVLYEVSGGVATVTLNDPEKRNRLSQEMLTQLVAAISAPATTPTPRPSCSPGRQGVLRGRRPRRLRLRHAHDRKALRHRPFSSISG